MGSRLIDQTVSLTFPLESQIGISKHTELLISHSKGRNASRSKYKVETGSGKKKPVGNQGRILSAAFTSLWVSVLSSFFDP